MTFDTYIIKYYYMMWVSKVSGFMHMLFCVKCYVTTYMQAWRLECLLIFISLYINEGIYMSFPMTHMLIAYKIVNRRLGSMPERSYNPASFIVGSIAPDVVHFRDDYCGEIKGRSHLWHYGPRWGITTDFDGWLNNILAFYESMKESNIERSFLEGYVTHLLTDYLNDKLLWIKFRDRYLDLSQGMEELREGVSQAEWDEAFATYRKELYITNQWLYGNTKEADEILHLLETGERIIIKDYYEMPEYNAAIESLCHDQFSKKDDYGEAACRYYTPKVACDFIDDSVEYISHALGL